MGHMGHQDLLDRIERLEAELSAARQEKENYIHFFQALIKYAPFAAHLIREIDNHYHILAQNDLSKKLFGVPIDSEMKVPLKDRKLVNVHFFKPDGKTSVMNNDMPGPRAFLGEHYRNEPFIFKHDDGKEFHVEISASPLYDSAGNVDAVIVVILDITHLKDLENALVVKRREAEELFTNIPTILWRADMSVDGDFSNTYISSVVDEFLALPPGTIKNDWSVYFSRVVPKYLLYIKEKFKEGAADPGSIVSMEYEVLKGDGSNAWFRSTGRAVPTKNGFTTFGHTSDITASKIAEQKVLDSETRFRMIYKNAPIMIDSFDAEGNCVLWNDRCEQMLGYSFEEIQSMPDVLSALYPDKDLQNLVKNSLLRCDGTFKEFMPLDKNGNIRNQLWANFKLPNGHIISTGIDITERKKMETDLHETRENFYSIFKNSTIGLYKSTPDGKILSANPALLNMLGYSSFDGVKERDLSVTGYLDPKKRDLFKEIIEKDGEISRFDADWLTKDGRVIHVRESAVAIRAIGSGAIQFYIGSVHDVTEIKKAEQKQKQQQRELEVRGHISTVFATAGNKELYSKVLSIFRVETKSKFGFFGYINKAGDLVSQSMTDEIWDQCKMADKSIIFTRDQWGGAWGKSLIQKKSIIKNQGLSLPQGHVQLQSSLSVPIIFHEELIGLIVLGDKEGGGYTENDRVFVEAKCQYMAPLLHSRIHDQEYEQNLIQAKKRAEESDALKSAFMATMSHELRTPLNSIIGFSELLLEEEFEGEDVLEYSQLINGSGKDLLNIIEDILNIALIDSGEAKLKLQTLELEGVLLDILNSSRSLLSKTGKNDVLLNVEIPSGHMGDLVYTDEGRFKQIFNYLLTNAVKFTEKGSIIFGYHFNDAHECVFFVKDTGIGIRPEHQHLIFERFRQADDSFTRKFGGIGLGLHTTVRLLELLGGRIWLESEPDQGSCFFFTIPGAVEIEDTEPTYSSEDALSLSGHHILIAEDDENSRSLLQFMFEGSQAKVYIADNGEEVLNIMERHPEIDLVLMDLKMPKLDGFKATEIIRQKNKSVFIIAITAFGMEGNSDKAIRSGCDACLLKPIRRASLMGILRNWQK